MSQMGQTSAVAASLRSVRSPPNFGHSSAPPARQFVPFPEVGAAPFDCARMAVGNGVSAMQSQCRESTQARSMARFASVANSVHGHAPSSLALHPSIFTTAVSGGRARSSGTMRRIWSSV